MATETDQVTIKEVAQSIGWLDAMTDDIEFNTADWSHVEDDGLVYLEGRKGDLLIDVTVRITEVNIQRDWDADWDADWDNEDDEDE